MTELEKYRRLAERLQENKGQEHSEALAEFYFRQLQRLEIDLLLAEIEVAEQHRQISAIETKIGFVRQEQRQNEGQNRRAESSSEEVVGQYCCPLKECGKRFQKQSGLRLHQKLMHGPIEPFLQEMVFDVELEEP